DAIQVGHATNVRVADNNGSELGYPADQVDVETSAVAVAVDTAGNVDHSVYTRNQFTDVNGQCIDLDGFHDGEVTGNSCINRKPIEAYPALHAGIVFGATNPDVHPGHVVITDNTIAGFAFGALYLLGNGNRIENNQFLDMNRAHCGMEPTPARCNYARDQPDLLRAGVYLAKEGTGNIVRNNTITGYGIEQHCIAAAPGVSLKDNIVSPNICRNH
ncbi:MAG: right-handed parallel beta-helix repeat-containing protein, partial [Acidobacteriota bacterium]|nr:right-handed parallel beta-helix repeat-containing protein [Acidobacteriota bacterium]